MPNKNFYKINFEREVVLQDKSTTFLSINRNDDHVDGIPPNKDLIVLVYPQGGTFNTYADVTLTATTSGQAASHIFNITGYTDPKESQPAFNAIEKNLVVENWPDFDSTGLLAQNFGGVPLKVSVFDRGNKQLTLTTQNGGSFVPPPTPIQTKIGVYDDSDFYNWRINSGKINEINNTLQPNGVAQYWVPKDTTIPNPFDGSTIQTPYTYGQATGFVSRFTSTWIRIPYTQTNINTNGVTFQIDYDGKSNSHLKICFYILAADNILNSSLVDPPTSSTYGPFGMKDAQPSLDWFDYQEVHLFGYTQDYVKTSRDNSLLDLPISSPLYDDNISYGLLKTNPKLSGNVKLTVDSAGSLSLNSFNANDELSDSSYKKFSVSENSTYQKDLYEFFKKGTTPSEIIFDVFQVDDQYLNTKRSYDQQFDNFYNYGVEQLNSKFYDENFSFLAPIWLRKEVPDYFVIFRVDGPINPDSYIDSTVEDNFSNYFKNARIIKTFDMRNTSKLGMYIRKIVNDNRFKERPLEVSWENDIATYFYGISYQNGTLTNKGEFLYDYYKKDRPIKEFEEFITSGFQRNGIISSNLINLEFLFDDDEAPLYGINRYFGLYVKENQLAEFEIEPAVLGKIYDQSPPPKLGVDGQPYSLRDFIQTNPNGIQIPVHYYHNTSYENNTSIVPNYVGNVEGKFPLPNMVDDPMRFFYVKDRNDIFKRINKIAEVDYGTANTDDYIRATQLQVFDTQENMSVYGGVTNIVSQFPAELLNGGNSQLRIHLNDYRSTGVLADDEKIIFDVKRYNDQDSKKHIYYAQISQTTLGVNATVQYFIDQNVQPIVASFNQPAAGSDVTVQINDGTVFNQGETVYIVNGGYYKIKQVLIVPNPNVDILTLTNLGGNNAAPGTNVPIHSLIGQNLSGTVNYVQNNVNSLISLDNYLTLNLTDFSSGYSQNDSWRIEVDYPSIQKFKIVGTRNVDVIYKQSFDKFRWVLTANPIGMQAGDAWDYPMQTPNTNEFISTFSNEGTPTQVAQAIVKCINSFENSPVKACSVDNVIYMSSNYDYEDGNSILFTRELTDKSYYSNLGFYSDGNVNVKSTVTQKKNFNVSSIDLNPIINEKLDTPVNKGFYFKIRKNSAGITVQGKINCDVSSYATAITTGTSFWKVPTTNLLEDSAFPFSLDLTNIPQDNNFYEFMYEADADSSVSQFFIGGVTRNRNRARVKTSDATNYYDNLKVTRLASMTSGSNVIFLDTTDIYISAPISGKGIPSGSRVIDVNNSSITINKTVTLTSTSNALEIGEIILLNRKPILQQWYQAQKGLFSRMKSWDVQGLLLYTLPNLETPTYDDNGVLISFKDAEEFSILQLENPVQEFYISNDDRIVAWNVYRPSLGLFSVYPIKQFDFDFIFSDYSYSPINEALTYYKEYELSHNQSVELSMFENYIFDVTTKTSLNNTTTSPFSIQVSVYNKDSDTWYLIDTLNLNNTISFGGVPPKKATFLFNTFYPIYVYDQFEFPFLSPYGYVGRANPTDYTEYTYTMNPQNKSAGSRNFNKKYLRTYNKNTEKYDIFYPSKIKVKFICGTGGTLNIKNYNYSNDKDLEFFTGFAGLQDIQNSEDIARIESLKDSGDYVTAYAYQLMLSEYDRLRENYNKDFAVSSIVVPYINKWVQKGTDARENYYRLNTSSAFGVTNMSPSSQIDFAEASMFTQEFLYIDATPKDFYLPGYSESRSYMFEKLTDVAYNGKTWYELLTSNDDNDWFLKYFAVGYPSEIDENKDLIKKPREERYTFLNYDEGTGKNQTLFRGGKIQGISLDDTILTNITEIENSKELDGYKFAAIAQFLKPDSVTYQIDKPYKFEIIKNEKYKSILMVITVYYDDYRMQHGHYDYMSQYFMTDLLKNSNTSQLKLFSTSSGSTAFSKYKFYPYDGTVSASTAISNTLFNNVLRPRQGFLGGGYLDLNHKKLSSTVDYSGFTQTNYDITTGQFNNVTFKQLFPNYPNLLDELNTTLNSYRISDTYPSNYAFIYVGTPALTGGPIIASQQAKDGFFYGFSVDSSQSLSSFNIRMILDSQNNNPAIQPLSLNFGTNLIQSNFNVTDTPLLKYPILQAGIDTQGIAVTSSSGSGSEKKTFSIEGGSKGYESIQSFISFSNIQTLINNNLVIEYYKVSNNTKQNATDFKLAIVNPDEIIKNNVLQYTEDTDKPQEYLDKDLIGFNIVDTNMNEYLVRHRGYYEPKTRDVLSFWVREDNELSKHFQKDFLLNNTHISSNTVYSGLIKNYGFNKVATGGEVLKVTRAAAYKSLYPLIDEVAVSNGDLIAIDSSWDANYYRDYSTTTDYVSVNGIKEMRELKTFLASKAMNVPRSHEMHTFISDEVQFNLQALSTPLGVSQLVKDTKSASQNVSDANKPILTINIDVKKRLLRQLIEDINSGLYVDEFNKLTGYLNTVTALSNLTAQDIKKLKTEYLEKNILNLYEVTEINLYSLKKQGVELVNLELTEQEKSISGYKINKNCKVVKTSDFTYTITVVLDTKDPVGFSLSTIVKRI